MQISILIDKLTPCLIENSTGEVLNTVFKLAADSELEGLQAKGWLFDWSNIGVDDANIYKLLLENDDVIQGLVAAKVEKGSVYIVLVESAPHNLGDSKKYKGVGGHLIAIAIKLSHKMEFGGYVHFDAKNQELATHYTNNLGAKLIGGFHEYRMIIDEVQAQEILKEYTLKGDLQS